MKETKKKRTNSMSGFLRTAIAFLLILSMLSGCQNGNQAEQRTKTTKAEESGAVTEAPKTENLQTEDVTVGELVVGNPTAMKGDFFTEMFGNNTADLDVRALIHGYNLVNWDQSQTTYILDPSVVKTYSTMTDTQGNKTYTLTLWNDLRFSDGSAISAWDYAFSLLLLMSPEVERIGGKIYRAEHILGHEKFLSGESRILKGVRVTGDLELSITLDHSFLPYFYEESLLLCVPYPIKVLAPGCKVYDDGEGVYIGDEDDASVTTVYTAELLQKTILDETSGYNSHPSVCSGPYILTSFDGREAQFTANPYFKGAYSAAETPEEMNQSNIVRTVDGSGKEMILVKPSIEKITYTTANNDTLAEDFKDGKLQLVNKVTYGSAIDKLLDEEVISSTNYSRVGLAFLSFSCELPTVREKEVRQAIAWCMDRDKLTLEYCGKYGNRVDGYYGIGQWEYRMLNGELNYPIESANTQEKMEKRTVLKNRYASNGEEYKQMLSEWKALSLGGLVQYTVNTEKANALLDKAGWTLNQDGEEWQAGKDQVRCKRIDGELVPLELTMMVPEGNHIVDTLQENFIDNLNACGIQLKILPAPMTELLSAYYRETERDVDMIYLATNFHVVVDPSITFSTDTTAGHQMWNNTYSNDEILYQLAVDMRKTQPEDIYGYMTKWIAFQKRYNEVLPAIPIYSNVYYDFYTPSLQNYRISSHTTWAQAIVSSYLKTS